jgi:mannosyltransferase OCH1-like enzyme
MIPKKIHYCWFGPRPMPKLVVNCIRTWRMELPDYEFILWNEDNSPMEKPFIKQAYQFKKYAFVSDFVRFWALFKQGGIYLDTDMYVLKDFDDLLNNKVFFAWETKSELIISCGVIGSIPKQDFIGGILTRYESMQFSISSISELVIPRIVSGYFNNYINKDEVTVYPFDYFYAFPYDEKENIGNFLHYRTENSYAIHLWNVSWGTFKDKLRDKIIYRVRKIWPKKK